MMRTINPMVFFFTFVTLWSVRCPEVNAQTEDLPNTVADGAVLKEIASGFRFTEGPAVDPEGHLFFTDLRGGRIHKLERSGDVTTFRASTTGRASGLIFDAQGRLNVCETATGRVTRTELDGSVTVLADQFGGKRFNFPNDLFITRGGSVYFTDSYFGRPSRQPQPVTGVYRIAPDGIVKLVVADLDQPNGIVFNLDETTLFVTNDNPSGVGEIWAFDIQTDRTLANRRLFATAGEIMDGMTLDAEGNLYAASFNNSPSSEGRGIWVFDPNGAFLGLIPTPEQPSNCALAGNILYVTASTKVYSIRLNVTGVDRTQHLEKGATE